MTVHNEKDLLCGARNLEPDILVEIYDQYNSGLFAYAYRLLHDANLAEDCVSETFLRFLRMLKNDTGPSNHLKAYLYRIAHNWITDHYRQKINQTMELSDELENPSDIHLEKIVDSKIEMTDLHTALMSLNPDHRLVLTLRFIEGWDNNQVAAAIERPVGAVKALQHRALTAMQKIMCARGER